MVILADLQRLMASSPDQLKKIFAEHGVDVNQPQETPEERAKRITVDERKSQRMWERQKAKVYAQYSLWPGDNVVSFSFADWKPNLQPDSQQARAIGLQAWELSKKLTKKPFNVFMNGVPGVGKTSLALAMMDEASKQGLSTMFVSTIVLQSICYESYQDFNVLDHLNHIKRAMKEVDFLVLDDFGTEGGSLNRVNSDRGYGTQLRMQQVMQEVADARWDSEHNQPHGHAIVSSNNFEKELVKIYDPKTISRLIPRDKRYRIGFNGMEDVRGMER